MTVSPVLSTTSSPRNALRSPVAPDSEARLDRSTLRRLRWLRVSTTPAPLKAIEPFWPATASDASYFAENVDDERVLSAASTSVLLDGPPPPQPASAIGAAARAPLAMTRS